MLQPERYLLARHEADHHVVVEVVSTSPPGRTPGLLRVEGRVVELYRTGGTLKPGDTVRFNESVMEPGDEIPCGGTLWKPRESVQGARYIEAFLNGTPPDCGVALWQSEVVPAPRGSPRMDGHFALLALRERLLRDRAGRGPWWRRLFR